jgi:hypothetical protein
MSEVIEKEFSQEDIDNVKKLQSDYSITTAQVGQIEIELHLLKKRLAEMEEMRISLFDKYNDLQKQESELVKSLNEKYGDGVLDLDSGKFIPSQT